ncbi:MAG: extracellular solute-binding protein [candidate division NC10 bacterium]|nr:extracellular solute-binding protein [candidate division NC10 bacterium]
MRTGRAVVWGWMVVILAVGVWALQPDPAWGQARKFPGTRLNVLSSSGHRQFNPVWDKLSELEQQTGIKVALTRVPTGEIRQKIMQDLVMGTGQFDVYEIPDDTIFSASQHLTSLEPFIKKDYGSVEAWGRATVTWANRVATIRGDVRTYPFYSGTVAGAYRENLFKDPKNRSAFKTKYGYDLPTPPKTWKELVDAAQFFTRQEGGEQLWGVVFPGKQDPGLNIFEMFLFEEGVTFVDEQNHSLWGPKHPENQATVAKVAEFLQELIYKHKAAPTTIPGMATNESVDMYLNGKAAMIVDLIYFAWDEIKSQKVSDRIGVSVSFQAPTSGGPSKGGIPFYWMWGVSGASKNKDAAWEFLRWFVHEPNLKLTLTKGIGVYVPTDTRIGDWAAQENVLPPAVIAAIKQAQVYRLNPQIGQVRQTVRKYVEKLLLKELTPREFAVQSGNEVEQLMVTSGLVPK